MDTVGEGERRREREIERRVSFGGLALKVAERLRGGTHRRA